MKYTKMIGGKITAKPNKPKLINNIGI